MTVAALYVDPYAHGVAPLPALRWGRQNDQDAWGARSWTRPPSEGRPRVGAALANATPERFRDVLLAMAQSVSTAHTVVP